MTLQTGNGVFGIPDHWLLFGGILALVIGVLLRYQSERRGQLYQPTLDRLEPSTRQEVPGPIEADIINGTRFESLVDTAKVRHSRGEYTEAIDAAFLATQEYFGTNPDEEFDGNHWDFYTYCVEKGLVTDPTPLRELVELYEEACTVAESEPSAIEARRSIDIVLQLAENSNSTPDSE